MRESTPRRVFVAAAAVMITHFLAGVAIAQETSLTGSYKTYLSGIYDAGYQDKSAGIATGLLRLNGGYDPHDWLSLDGAYLLYPEIRSARLETAFLESVTGSRAEYRVADPRHRLFPTSEDDVAGAALYHEIDRAFATVYLPAADLTLGRQAIAWGSARVVNPTDVIVPYQFTAIDTEYRRGVDAVRLRLPFGAFNEVDAGVAFGDEFQAEENAYYLRPSFYLLETDIGLPLMIFRENALAGLSLSRAVGEAGAWLEVAYVVPDAVDTPDDPYAEDYVQASLGADRNLTPDLYAYAEYHHNGAGSLHPDDYLSALGTTAYIEGNSYLLGRHYGSVGATYTVGPLLPVDALVVVNLTDGSAELTLSAEYNFKENVYIGGGLLLGIGAEPETVAAAKTAVPLRYRSEFGAYPEVFYTEVRLYF